LHFAARNNEHGTPLFACAIATLVYEHISIEKHFPEEMGTEVKESSLLNTELLECMDMMIWHRNPFLYRYMGIDGQMVSIMPPCTELFDRNTEKWVVHEVQPHEEPQEQRAPQHPWGAQLPHVGEPRWEGAPSFSGDSAWSAPSTYGRGACGWGDDHPGY
jgi:hypothetical protein